MQEEWLPLPGYENRYLVSNLGRIASLRNGSMRELKQSVDSRGYCKVTLSKDGHLKTFKVHRLVGLCFLENPNGYPEINHRNEDKFDNRVSNLEWCTRQYNVTYGSRTERQRRKISKPVIQFDKWGLFVEIFDSTVEAEKATGLSRGCISECCRGLRQTCGGYRWQYG